MDCATEYLAPFLDFGQELRTSIVWVGFPVTSKLSQRDAFSLGDIIYQARPHAMEHTPELEQCLTTVGAYRH